MSKPNNHTAYFQDDTITLYHGDSREITEWLAAATAR